MRFARLRKNSGDDAAVKQSFTNRLIFVAYNVVWWIPIVLPILGVIDYNTGFVAFAAITVVRAGANLATNNVLKLTREQFERYPFRTP